MGIFHTILLKPTAVIDDSFKMTVSMSALETMVIPATGTNNFTIDWGDGTSPEVVTTSSPSHEYVDADSYQISITGTMTLFAFNNGGSKLNITSIDQFGDTGLTSLFRLVFGCGNLVTVDTSGLDTAGMTTLNSSFRDCTSLTTLDVSSWDVSSMTSFNTAFQSCSSLTTLDVSSWDVSNVTILFNTFFGCTSLTTINTDSWNTGSITNCTGAFQGCTSVTSSFDEFRWWNRTDDLTSGGTPDPIGTFTNCFTSSTNISNFASIPNNWKGL